jgi:hypothetical protein
MQAAALSDAVASITHTGTIDTTGVQGGAVDILAEHGQIRVSGSITANSTAAGNKGSDIYIGREDKIDPVTGKVTTVLAAATDVSGAKLESNQGFVETSGDVLSTTGTRVKAGEWLLDPYNITIAAGAATGTNYASFTSGADSVILASDISANLTAGTSVTIATGDGDGGASVGNIAVNESIAKTGGVDATLTLKAHGNINVAAGKTITSTVGKLNTIFNSDSDGLNGGGITFGTGSGITSNGGNITLGGGTALNGTGFATADGSSLLQGISMYSAKINAGGGDISMRGQTAVSSTAVSLADVFGIYIAGTGSEITTTVAGTIDLLGSNQNLDALSRGFVLSGGTITGGSSGAVKIVGDSRPTISTFSDIKGASIGGNGTVTSTGGHISIKGYAGQGSKNSSGLEIAGKVIAVGAGAIDLLGEANLAGSGGNVGLATSGAAEISSFNGNINITGTGGSGNGYIIRNHGVVLDSSTAVKSTGTGSITLTGTAVNVDNGYSYGVDIRKGGLQTKTGDIKIDAVVPANYQVAAIIGAAVTSESGNVYVRSAGGKIYNSSAGTISGNNVSIDNSKGTIDAHGVITSGTGGASTFPGVLSQIGVDLQGSVTAANNLNIYGNQTGSDAGVKMSGASTTISGKNVTINGKSSSGNGVLLSGATLSGAYLNVTGATTTGYNGFAWSGGNINTTGTGGTSAASTIKGISAASTTASDGYGAFMMYDNGAANAASGTTLTLAGEAKTLSTGQNTKERGILVRSGSTLTATGDITLDGSSKSSDGIGFDGILDVRGTNSKLTIKGITAASSNGGLSGVNISGTIINNGTNTQPITFIGEATNKLGSNIDTAVNISGTVNGGMANVNVQAKYGKIGISAGTVGAAINGANISIDNTLGTIDANTGAINAGTGTSNYTNAINLSGALNATGYINVLGNVETTTNAGVSLATTGSATTSGSSSIIKIQSNGYIVNNGVIGNTGSSGATSSTNLTSTSGSISGSGTLVAKNLYMTATSGAIGTSLQRINTNVDNLSLNSAGSQYITEANAATVAAKSTAGGIDIATTNGTLTVGTVNGTTGLTAGNDIKLTTTSSTEDALRIVQKIESTTGDVIINATTSETIVPLSGRFAAVKSSAEVKGKNITMDAVALGTTGQTLGYYGAGGTGVFTASNNLSLKGSTQNAGNGFYMWMGAISAGNTLSIEGTSALGQGVGFDGTGSTPNVTVTSGKGITIKGTASSSTSTLPQTAINLKNVNLTNSSGAVTLEAIKGDIKTEGTGTLIQNGNGGVKLTTVGDGNITVPKIINNETGDVVIAAGSDLLAGNGTGGQVKTVAGNTITQANATPGNTYLYTGNANDTGSLSTVGGFANGLFLSTIGLDTVNAASNTAYASGPITGGAKTQVMFREKVALNGNLNNATVTYGDSTNSAAVKAALQTANPASGTSNVFSTTRNAGTFKILNADFFADMSSGKPSVDTALSLDTNKSNSGNLKANSAGYDIDIAGAKYTFDRVAKLEVKQKSLTALYLANNKVFDGNTNATLASATLKDIIGIDDVKPTNTSATFDTAAVGTGKTVRVAGIKLTGDDAANYTIDTTATTTANITDAPVRPPSPPIPPSPRVPTVVTGSATPFALASAEDLDEDVCSANSIENCYCEESIINKDVDICYEPLANKKRTAR